jgi:hypothetical protein
MVGLVACVLLGAEPSALRARAALQGGCARCHAGGPDADEGGFDFLLDREALVREGLVVPGRPAASKLLLRVRRGEMPPAEAKAERARARPQLAEALKAWIEAGAPADGFSTPRPAVPEPVTQATLLREMLDDLDALPAADRRHVRYFIGDAGPELDKALSSLTWGPELARTVVLSPQLRRVDLRALRWSSEQWERVLLPAYPFGVASGSVDEEAVARVTGSTQPFVRADWFVGTATRPPLYHALLGLPSTEAGLEALLQVDVKDDVRRAAVVRAGFNNSGVSRNNRLIERHASRDGPYWRSYDFASNVGPRNLFERPLTFVHDGGEHIFALPNGLFGFLLTNAKGERIDRGPTTIVRDERRPDGAVENGLSCMGCHARGFIPKDDQVLASVQASPSGFSVRERQQLLLLHPAPRALAAAFELDTARFLSALELLGVSVDAEEPITAAVLRYEKPLDLQTAARELAVPPHVLFRALDDSLAPLRVGGAVKRDAFTAAFPRLVLKLGLGRARPVAPSRGASECGASGGGVDARVEDCALAFAEGATKGPFHLVSRTAEGREVWLDERQGLLWSAVEPATSQSEAARQCGGEASVEALWFLPSAAQLEEALADGLPGAGWQPLWSRDVDHGHKYAAPGVAVGASGRVQHEPTMLLASRCAARM